MNSLIFESEEHSYQPPEKPRRRPRITVGKITRRVFAIWTIVMTVFLMPSTSSASILSYVEELSFGGTNILLQKAPQ